MKKMAVVIYGPNGAGKGTQANLLAWTRGFIHFDSGKYLRTYLWDPENLKKAYVKKQRKNYDNGILLTPSFILDIFSKETNKIAKAGMSIVYSGSPRTVFESFGSKSVVGLVPLLKKLYGKENLIFFFLDIKPSQAIKRNTIRRICQTCGNGILGTAKIKTCPICMGKLIVRSDDKPRLIKERINQYITRTKPVIAELKKQKYKIININAARNPSEVFKEIDRHIQRLSKRK